MTARINYFIILFLISVQLFAQDTTSTKKNNQRLIYLSAGTGVVYTGSMFALHQLWYKDFERQPFTFFNDNHEWKQMDKLGHVYSAFQISSIGSRSLQWAGVESAKSDLIGSVVAFGLLLPIEIFDGYSAAYGASLGDLAANALGAGLYYSQSKLWNEIRLHPKVSFQRSAYASLRPEVLGNNYITEFIKDYNGQTQWLSVDVDKFTPFPKWLNIAIGYSANGMVYARDTQNNQMGYTAYRQYFLAIDPDLQAIKSNSKFVRTLLYFVNMIKIPAPAIEFSQGKQKLHLFYY